MSLKLKQLELGYTETVLKFPTEFTVPHFSLVPLLGINGAGKSTFLKCFVDSSCIIKGNLTLNEKKLTPQFISYVPSRLPEIDLDCLTILKTSFDDYINNWGNVSETEMDFIVNKAKEYDIDHFLTKNFNELSDGQRQKILLVRSIMQDRPIMLLDEPMAHLDYSNRISLLSTLQKLTQEKKKIIIFSTHEWDLIYQNCEKAMFIGEGKAWYGKLEDAVQSDVMSWLVKDSEHQWCPEKKKIIPVP